MTHVIKVVDPSGMSSDDGPNGHNHPKWHEGDRDRLTKKGKGRDGDGDRLRDVLVLDADAV